MKYAARSLEEIADHFNRLGVAVGERLSTLKAARGHPTREMHALEAEAATWFAARDVLLQTELHGKARGGASKASCGAIGGRARADKLSPERRSEIASAAATARWGAKQC